MADLHKIPDKLRHNSKRILAFVRAGPGVFADTALRLFVVY